MIKMSRRLKQKQKIDKFLILEHGIGPVEILFMVFSLIGLFFLPPLLSDLSIFPTLEEDVEILQLYFLTLPISIILIFIATNFKPLKTFGTKRSGIDELIPKRKGDRIKAKDLKKRDPIIFAIGLGINIALVFAVQVIPAIFFEAVPQSIPNLVRLLFSATGIAEEIFFRLFLIGGLQYIISRAFEANGVKGQDLRFRNMFVGLILTIGQAALFVLTHTNYIGDPLALTVTFLTGLVQGIMYLIHKDTLILMVSHIAVNLAAVELILPAIQSIITVIV